MSINVSKDDRFLQLRQIAEELSKEYGISSQEVFDFSKEVSIPVSILVEETSGFESIVKYLLENKKLSKIHIAKITGRSKQNIWQTYENASKKKAKKFVVRKSGLVFPLSIIKSKYSVLESIVKYLKEELNLKFKDISRLLSKDERTVWTVYNRSMKK